MFHQYQDMTLIPYLLPITSPSTKTGICISYRTYRYLVDHKDDSIPQQILERRINGLIVSVETSVFKELEDVISTYEDGVMFGDIEQVFAKLVAGRISYTAKGAEAFIKRTTTTTVVDSNGRGRTAIYDDTIMKLIEWFLFTYAQHSDIEVYINGTKQPAPSQLLIASHYIHSSPEMKAYKRDLWHFYKNLHQARFFLTEPELESSDTPLGFDPRCVNYPSPMDIRHTSEEKLNSRKTLSLKNTKTVDIVKDYDLTKLDHTQFNYLADLFEHPEHHYNLNNPYGFLKGIKIQKSAVDQMDWILHHKYYHWTYRDLRKEMALVLTQNLNRTRRFRDYTKKDEVDLVAHWYFFNLINNTEAHPKGKATGRFRPASEGGEVFYDSDGNEMEQVLTLDIEEVDSPYFSHKLTFDPDSDAEFVFNVPVTEPDHKFLMFPEDMEFYKDRYERFPPEGLYNIDELILLDKDSNALKDLGAVDFVLPAYSYDMLLLPEVRQFWLNLNAPIPNSMIELMERKINVKLNSNKPAIQKRETLPLTATQDVLIELELLYKHYGFDFKPTFEFYLAKHPFDKHGNLLAYPDRKNRKLILRDRLLFKRWFKEFPERWDELPQLAKRPVLNFGRAPTVQLNTLEDFTHMVMFLAMLEEQLITEKGKGVNGNKTGSRASLGLALKNAQEVLFELMETKVEKIKGTNVEPIFVKWAAQTVPKADLLGRRIFNAITGRIYIEADVYKRLKKSRYGMLVNRLNDQSKGWLEDIKAGNRLLNLTTLQQCYEAELILLTFTLDKIYNIVLKIKGERSKRPAIRTEIGLMTLRAVEDRIRFLKYGWADKLEPSEVTEQNEEELFFNKVTGAVIKHRKATKEDMKQKQLNLTETGVENVRI